MDWVSQINFYHHYLNQRVVMITGGTGVGKSTQTPKLLLYGLKAFDKRFKGKVICTQPRVAPTVNNAERISYELGVPIKNYSSTYKQNIKTTYGYIQYKYEKDTHIDDDQEFFLRIVTDGTLLNEIKNSPLLKKVKDEKRNDINKYTKLYSTKNLYDIVIVDESHEHNTNMDMILTMVRTSIFLNNQLRLYIVSATMDLDDPIYRKYYRYINDNLLYPIRDVYNVINEQIEFNLLDRCVIDRRIHISPPGETTQYKITEIYHTIELNEKESYKLAIKYAIDICTNTTPINSDILLFCTTSTNIIKLVDELNLVLPSNTIAIPYYRDLPEESKSLISNNLDQFKKKIKFQRNFIHDVLNNKKKIEQVSSNYSYERVLIVSTNIAEASITINSLKYVIDTGFNNDVSYNYETDTNNIEIIKISEASRLQRKGRVGRVSDGSVYYTYPQYSRLNIKPSYSICQGNFASTFLDLVSEKEDKFRVYDDILYPYLLNQKYNDEYKEDLIILIDNFLNEEQEKILDNKEDVQHLKINFTLFKILMLSQYFTTFIISSNLCHSKELYNVNLINTDEYDFLVPTRETGIYSDTLIDKKLNYYLIHPYENKFQEYRNKNTRLLDIKHNSQIDKINLLFKRNIIKKLKFNLYIFQYNEDFLKSRIVEYLNKLKQLTKNKLLELNLFYPLIVGYKLGIYKNILFIIYFLLATNNNLLEIVENSEKFNKFFLNKESDLLIINNIFNLFKNTYKHILFDDNIEKTVDKSFEDFKNDYNNYKNNKLYLIKPTNYNDLIDLILKNDDLEKLKQRLSEKISPKKIPDYINIEIKNWCNTYGINYITFINILNDYNKQYINLEFILNNPNNTEFIDKSLIENELTVDKNIIKSFIYGNMNKIFIYENKKYHNIINYNSLINYAKNSFKKKWISNIVENKFILSLNIENDKISDLSKNDDDETNNQKVILNILSNIDDKTYANILYIKDNPVDQDFIKTNINQYVCNNQ